MSFPKKRTYLSRMSLSMNGLFLSLFKITLIRSGGTEIFLPKKYRSSKSDSDSEYPIKYMPVASRNSIAALHQVLLKCTPDKSYKKVGEIRRGLKSMRVFGTLSMRSGQFSRPPF